MKMLTVPLLVCVMMALTGAAAGCCPGGWTKISGRCFLYVSTTMTWANAEKSCQDRGGNLASVHSHKDYTAIQAMIQPVDPTNPRTWLGGYDATQEGTWFWSDGTPFKFNYWRKGEPNNSSGSEHCLDIEAKGEWNDLPCSYTLPFVCSKKP